MTATKVYRFTIGEELANLKLTLYDDDGTTLIDFSVPYTFELKIGTPGLAAELTKTTGITGATTAPNVTVAFDEDELDALTAGLHVAQLRARRTADDKDHYFSFWLRIKSAIL